VILPAVVLIALGVAFAVLEAKRTPDWRIGLDEYLESVFSPAGRMTVELADRASKPWNFRKDMGDAVIRTRMWDSIELPVPPKEVMCVLLVRTRSSTVDAGGARLVFVGFHTDNLWKQGWIVYEGPESPFTQAVKEDLASIGCDLELEQWSPDRAGVRA